MKTREFTLEQISQFFSLPPHAEVLDQTPSAFLVAFNIGPTDYLEFFTKKMFHERCHLSMVLGHVPRGRIRGVGIRPSTSMAIETADFIEAVQQCFDTTPLLFHKNQLIRDFFKEAV